MYHKEIGSDEEGEQVAGPLTVWHYHPMRTANYPEYINQVVSRRSDIETTGEVFDRIGSNFESVSEFSRKKDRTAEMMHVWFIEHPEGPFATTMSVPAENLQEPEKMTREQFEKYAMQKFNLSH
jgi:hypothetical protein